MAIKQTESDVQAASERFYSALTQMANGDAEPMLSLLPRRDDVTTMHPIGGREVGYDAVAASFQGVASAAEGGEVKATDRLVRVFGDVAYELVTEHASILLGGQAVEGEYRATNVYELEDGEWQIIHHHADTDESFIQAVESLGGE